MYFERVPHERNLMKRFSIKLSVSSLEKKLNWIRLCVLVPFFGMVLALLVMMVSFNEQDVQGSNRSRYL